jgi:hypothetical protein
MRLQWTWLSQLPVRGPTLPAGSKTEVLRSGVRQMKRGTTCKGNELVRFSPRVQADPFETRIGDLASVQMYPSGKRVIAFARELAKPDVSAKERC